MTLVQNPETGLFEEVSSSVVEDALKDTVDSSAFSVKSNVETGVDDSFAHKDLKAMRNQLRMTLKHRGMDTQQEEKLFVDLVKLFSLSD